MRNKINDTKNHIPPKTALVFHKYEVIISLLIASFVNAAILIMSAAAFFNSGILVATIDDAYRTLSPLFGPMASIVFAVALLSAGVSSSITGTLAGQSVLETLTDFKIDVNVRRIITRILNLIPTFIALYLGIEPLQILVYSQVALSLLIPLPLIPLIYYTSKKDLMGEFVNGKITTVVACILALVILLFNMYLLFETFSSGI
jgi:manganese transport protein